MQTCLSDEAVVVVMMVLRNCCGAGGGGGGGIHFDFSRVDEITRVFDDLPTPIGTTGNPKGVLLHHRGAHLNSLGNIMTWSLALNDAPVYLWTLPMFHCNGWCFPWTVAALAGTHVCLRNVTASGIYNAIADARVTHLCGAPIVMQMLINASEEDRREFTHRVKMMTAASPPPAPVLAAMKRLGIDTTHVYGLTEVYGPAVVCDWQEEWGKLGLDEQASKMSRQGVRYPVLEGLMVADPTTLVSDGRLACCIARA
jgi:fatty-acyl-CoA synthase